MTDNNIFLLLIYNSMSKHRQLVMKAICVFFVYMTVKNRLKSYDTNVPGYPDSNTTTISVSRPGEEDVENKRLNQEIKELKQSLETAEEAREETMENLNELLKLKMEAEIPQTDRTIEAAKGAMELEQRLEAAKVAKEETETECEETAKDLKKDIQNQTQKLEQAERTTQGLQQRFQERINAERETRELAEHEKGALGYLLEQA